MLKKILSISGKPGLFKLVSYGKSMIIVESLSTKKRMPAHSRDRIVSLGDISIYTTDEEVPLAKVFEAIKNKFDTKKLNQDEYKGDEQLDAFFKQVLPTYDEERVYKSDIKKIISWYNLMIDAGITDFETQEEEAPQDEAQSEA